MTSLHVDLENINGNNNILVFPRNYIYINFFLILDIFVETTTAAASGGSLLIISIFIPCCHSFRVQYLFI